MLNPRFAYIEADRACDRLFVAVFSNAADLRIIEVRRPDSALEDLQRTLRGLVFIATSAERLERDLTSEGFVAFDPIDVAEFDALFGATAIRLPSDDLRNEHRARLTAERVDWLVARGAQFNRQLERWATNVSPSIRRLFTATAEMAEANLDQGFAESGRRQGDRSRSDRRSDNPQDIEVTLADVFAASGGLSDAIPGYERRDGQAQMAAAVAETLEHEGILLVEAGTGIGKSLAYLVPAALWSQQHGEPVIVSTFTRGLQEQLVSKDIPIASKALQARGGRPLRGVALKGRANYLCLRRWMQEVREQRSEPAMDALKIKIAIWLESTTSGDRAELTLTPAEDRAFSALSATADNCLQTVCRASFGNRCFFNRTRAEAQKADIIVMNHALLFASVGEENTVLGGLDRIIIDEAHHVESVATAQFSFAVSGPRVERMLSEYAALQGSSIVGHCGRAVEALSSSGALHAKPANARKALEVLREAVTSVDRGNHWAELFFQAAARFVEDDDTTPYPVTRRILASTRDQPNWQTLSETWEQLDAIFAELLQSSRWLVGELNESAGKTESLEKVEPALLELSVWRRELEEMQTRLRAVVESPETDYVYWISGRRNANEASVFGAPLNVAPLVAGELLERTSSAVLASATLRSQGSFRMIRQQLGIEDAAELVLPSPFDYRASTMLYIARDVPDPRHAAYLDSIREAIAGLTAALDGRTLALFTSHAAIRTVYPSLRQQLETVGINVLAQDIDGTPNQLVERMKRNPNSVVLGVAAFWEGVDIPGEELSGLVVTRLPFEVPTDPLFAARSEQFEQPFQQYSLPRAALKFRQGFGRLIRTSSDRGVVAVLDSRIFTKSYGATFMRALPECTVRHGTVAELQESAVHWLRPRQ